MSKRGNKLLFGGGDGYYTETESHSVALAVLRPVAVLLSQSPESQVYRHGPPFLAVVTSKQC